MWTSLQNMTFLDCVTVEKRQRRPPSMLLQGVCTAAWGRWVLPCLHACLACFSRSCTVRQGEYLSAYIAI